MTLSSDLGVAVIGLGPMGRGIARVFDRAGARVSVVDADEELTARGLEQIAAEAREEDGGDGQRIVAARSLAEAVSGAALVVEAVVERMDVKQELLAELAAHAPEDAVVASNTSSLSIGEMGTAFGHPERVVGMHFFNPPTKMRLVEVIRGSETSDETVERAVRWSREAGKEPVVCADSPNFIVNRVCRPLYYEAQLLVTQGVEPARVDAIARGALGHRMGPLELLDFTGLHTHLGSSETALREFGDPRYRPIPLVRTLVRSRNTGRAAGRGFYDYGSETPRDGRARVIVDPGEPGPDPVVVLGPGAEGVASHPAAAEGVSATAPGPGVAAVIYAIPGAAADDDVEAVRRLVADGHPVVVDSSDGRWLDDLPSGAGWLRLHLRQREPFAEVVRDPVASIEPTPAVPAALAAVGARSVEVPGLPGLVADRLQQTMDNEAALVVEEQTAEPDAVDRALRLAMNHPIGPFEHLAAAGVENVVAGLRSMQARTGDPRYRPTQLLCRRAAGARR